ncbi:MAG: hypothetical protein M3042_01285 [Actinomycetota bacterium]|nr:hypothetical protein [Actinomycetota bacterium]
MADVTAVLRGGSRDGESTVVDDGVTRLLAASAAPGLLDVYRATDERVQLRGNTGEATVFDFDGQESAEGWAPETLHMPDRGA